MTTVMLVDDHAPLRRVLADVFAETDDISVVAECADGGEVVEAARRSRPDVVLMDISMPGVDGIEATRRLRAVQPEVRVVMLTGSFSPSTVRDAQRVGAVGYLLKGEDPFDLPDLVREVAAGGTAWSSRAAEGLAG